MVEKIVALRAKHRVQNELYKVRNKLHPFLEVTEREVVIAEKLNNAIIQAFYERHYDVVLKKVKAAYEFMSSIHKPQMV